MSDKVNDDDDCPERRVEHKSVKTNFLLEILQTKLLFFVILNKMMQHWNFFFPFQRSYLSDDIYVWVNVKNNRCAAHVAHTYSLLTFSPHTLTHSISDSHSHSTRYMPRLMSNIFLKCRISHALTSSFCAISFYHISAVH